MLSDGVQTQKRGSWIPGKEREEGVLASAISTDGRKDGTCKFCSESNVWTRWRCRRCYHDILAGLRGKYRQAIAGRTGEWSAVSLTSSREEDRKSKSLEAGNNELRARLEEKKGGEGAQGGQGLPSRRVAWRKSGEWIWTWRRRLRAGKSWMSKKKKLQEELREIKNSRVCRRRFRKAPRVTCCGNCKKWGKGGITSCHQSTRKCKKDHKICKAFKIKEEKKKKVLQHKRRFGRSERKLTATRNDVGSCRTKSTGTEWSMQKMAAQLQELQAGEERRGSNASQEVDCCMETRVESFFAVGADQARSEFDAMCQVFFKKFEVYTPSAQMA